MWGPCGDWLDSLFFPTSPSLFWSWQCTASEEQRLWAGVSVLTHVFHLVLGFFPGDTCGPEKEGSHRMGGLAECTSAATGLGLCCVLPRFEGRFYFFFCFYYFKIFYWFIKSSQILTTNKKTKLQTKASLWQPPCCMNSKRFCSVASGTVKLHWETAGKTANKNCHKYPVF